MSFSHTSTLRLIVPTALLFVALILTAPAQTPPPGVKVGR